MIEFSIPISLIDPIASRPYFLIMFLIIKGEVEVRIKFVIEFPKVYWLP